jgi:hypothetical protein
MENFLIHASDVCLPRGKVRAAILGGCTPASKNRPLLIGLRPPPGLGLPGYERTSFRSILFVAKGKKDEIFLHRRIGRASAPDGHDVDAAPVITGRRSECLRGPPLSGAT